MENLFSVVSLIETFVIVDNFKNKFLNVSTVKLENHTITIYKKISLFSYFLKIFLLLNCLHW